MAKNKSSRVGWAVPTLGYDEENRLVSAGFVSYDYDLLGRRISRTYNSVVTTYVWDGAHIIAEYIGSSLTKKYIYGPGMDNPVAMINVDASSNETWYYYYAELQGISDFMEFLNDRFSDEESQFEPSP